MAFPILLGTLVSRVKRRANKDGDDQVETTEWKEIIAEHYEELHSVATETGSRFYETEATLSLGSLALPTDHLETIGIDFVKDSAGSRRDLAQLMVQERVIFAGRTGEALFFALAGSNIALYPTPSTGTYKHLYVPQPTDYSTSADSTSVDVLNTYGRKYIVWGAASVGMHRDSSNQQRAMLERDRALEKFTAICLERAKGMPKRQIITDVRALGLGSMSDINGAWNPASWRYR